MEMKVDILDQHRWLEQFTGRWEVIDDPDVPDEQKSQGWIDTGRMLHGVWAVVEGSGQMPGGGEATTILTLGYDAAKAKFIGTWIGTMMSHMWVYEGDYGEDGRLVLDSLGPDFETGALRRYQDIYGFEGGDVRTLQSQMLADDGSWQVFMTARYRRVG